MSKTRSKISAEVLRRNTRLSNQNGEDSSKQAIRAVSKSLHITKSGDCKNNGKGTSLIVAVNKCPNKRLKVEITTLPNLESNSPEIRLPDSSISNSSSATTEDDNISDSESDTSTPEDQYEVQRIINFVRDGVSELYHVKWKGWDDEHNTWEPVDNLINCDVELYRFYLERKAESKNDSKRRRGENRLDVPPDPRPFEIRVDEFFRANKLGPKDYTEKTLQSLKSESLTKSQWSESKINNFLEKGTDGTLSQNDFKKLISELEIIGIEKKKEEIRLKLKGWENKINMATKGKPRITVENTVDVTDPPTDFTYVEKYVPGDGVVIPSDPVIGCECNADCYQNRKKECCPVPAGHTFAYTRFKKLNLERGSAIYECNSKCTCSSECVNRVVQDGKTDHKFCIFRTDNGRGWGVKTLQNIKKGTFVTLYLGEVITADEADKRMKKCNETGLTYLFGLDFNDQESFPYTVDATKLGNESHFINHSCSPNLSVLPVWVDCLDPNLPMLAMFATKDIAKNEELTFDYLQKSGRETSPRQNIEDQEDDNDSESEAEDGNKTRALCLCGSQNCRKYIFI